MQTLAKMSRLESERVAAYALVSRLCWTETTACALLITLGARCRPEKQVLDDSILLLAAYLERLNRMMETGYTGVDDCWSLAYLEPLLQRISLTERAISVALCTLATCTATNASYSRQLLQNIVAWLHEYHADVADTAGRYCPVTPSERLRCSNRAERIERAILLSNYFSGPETLSLELE